MTGKILEAKLNATKSLGTFCVPENVLRHWGCKDELGMILSLWSLGLGNFPMKILQGIMTKWLFLASVVLNLLENDSVL